MRIVGEERRLDSLVVGKRNIYTGAKIRKYGAWSAALVASALHPASIGAGEG